MTNKEAIAELKAMPIIYPITNGENDRASRLMQARDMAIKALEQEPKTEAVKTAIIQKLKDHFIEPEDAGLTIKGEYWLAIKVLAIIEETEPQERSDKE